VHKDAAEPTHVWEYQLTLINTFFKLCIMVFCEQILGSNNYNEWRAKKSHIHKNMGKLCLNAIKMAPHVLAPFPNRDFHFLCSASGVHTENIIICLYDKFL